MKRVIRFSRGFVPAFIVSSALIIFGLVGYFTKGLNLGVDFQAGINQYVQLAYPTLDISYAGKGNAVLSVAEDKLTIVFSGAEVDARTETFPFASFSTLGDLSRAIGALPEVTAKLREDGNVPARLLVPTFQGDTRLGPEPRVLHRAPASEAELFASIDKVRAAVSPLGNPSVQIINPPELQRYIVRLEDKGTDKAFSKTAADAIRGALEKSFGEGRVVVMRTDYVGAKYSEGLSRQAALLVLFTLGIILIYAWIRFKFQYGMGAVLAIFHDALIMVCFVVWTRMEFTTATIAAILTILGYSINDTIVQFDRVREERKYRPTEKFTDVLNLALSETLGRTIITTVTTMLTVLALIFFTSGSIRDFALALFVGMISGTYSTIFIASGFVAFWEARVSKRPPKAAKTASAPVKVGS